LREIAEAAINEEEEKTDQVKDNDAHIVNESHEKKDEI
jgi:hypothetical protein